MNLDIFEWIGYAASIVVAVSLVMSSILKFRWFNLIGSLLFALYGFLIHAWPVCFFNSIIVFINIYYLFKIYSKKESFEILEVKSDDAFLFKFFNFHSIDIKKFNPSIDFEKSGIDFSFFVLRNMSVAGLFLARKIDDKTLFIELDYVIAEYRDFKNGVFVYENLQKKFKNLGFTKIIGDGKIEQNARYFKKMGFLESENSEYFKDL